MTLRNSLVKLSVQLELWYIHKTYIFNYKLKNKSLWVKNFSETNFKNPRFCFSSIDFKESFYSLLPSFPWRIHISDEKPNKSIVNMMITIFLKEIEKWSILELYFPCFPLFGHKVLILIPIEFYPRLFGISIFFIHKVHIKIVSSAVFICIWRVTDRKLPITENKILFVSESIDSLGLIFY